MTGGVSYSLGYDGSLLNGLQALPSWTRDFHHPAGYTLGLISASYYLPKIGIAFVVPELCDRWGRKSAIWVGAFFMIAGAIVGGAAHNQGQLIGSRVLLGVGTVTSQVGAASLIPELAHPRIRHMCGSFLNTTYYVGSIFAAWLTFAMVYYPGQTSWAWRVPTIVQGLGPALLAIGTFWVPESPRWLMKQGRTGEAHEILAKYHANGKMDDELVMLEMKEIEAAIATEEIAKSGTWKSFIDNPGGRRRLAIIMLYLVPVLKQVGITAAAQTAGINGGLAIWNWFVSMTGATLVERFGRRPLFLCSITGMLACFCVMAGVAGGYAHTHNPATGIAIVPMIFLFMGSYSFALTPLPPMYIPEIAPLSIRAKATATLAFSQNTAQAFNQFVNPIALAAITWKYYLVYVAVLVVYLGLFIIYIRETKGLTTEEAAVIYEASDKKEAALEAEMKLRQAAEAAIADKFDPKADTKYIESAESRA
ncbi:putative Lactose permease [Pseudohyphozyma bogoriensis]|nr:putative Lactose permease [Pseudohyphozyma bogoriensis]